MYSYVLINKSHHIIRNKFTLFKWLSFPWSMPQGLILRCVKIVPRYSNRTSIKHVGIIFLSLIECSRLHVFLLIYVFGAFSWTFFSPPSVHALCYVRPKKKECLFPTERPGEIYFYRMRPSIFLYKIIIIYFF